MENAKIKSWKCSFGTTWRSCLLSMIGEDTVGTHTLEVLGQSGSLSRDAQVMMISLYFSVFPPFSCQQIIAGPQTGDSSLCVQDECLIAIRRKMGSWGRFESDESPEVKDKVNSTLSHPSLRALNQWWAAVALFSEAGLQRSKDMINWLHERKSQWQTNKHQSKRPESLFQQHKSSFPP